MVLEMLYFRVVLCIRQYFIVFPSTQFVIQIYHTFLHLLHVSAGCGRLQVHWVSQSPISFPPTIPTLASVYI
jgi:hypothetical protein